MARLPRFDLDVLDDLDERVAQYMRLARRSPSCARVGWVNGGPIYRSDLLPRSLALDSDVGTALQHVWRTHPRQLALYLADVAGGYSPEVIASAIRTSRDRVIREQRVGQREIQRELKAMLLPRVERKLARLGDAASTELRRLHRRLANPRRPTPAMRERDEALMAEPLAHGGPKELRTLELRPVTPEEARAYCAAIRARNAALAEQGQSAWEASMRAERLRLEREEEAA